MARLNLITDVPGIAVGHAQDMRVATGVTAVLIEGDSVAAGVVRGGAPGGRDIGLLEPEMSAQGVDAVVLGSERYGIMQAWHAAEDWSVSIPMSGKIDSLNVGNAAVLLLYEMFYQQEPEAFENRT